MQTTVQILILIGIAGFFAGLWALGIAIRNRKPLGRSLFCLLALVCFSPGTIVLMGLNPEWFFAEYSKFNAFHNDVKLGMTKDQVFDTKAMIYAETDSPPSPILYENTSQAISFFMSDASCESVSFFIEDGLVTRKMYSPD